ncbi:Ribose import ATP-binding protein RbsA [compost metagenome]
MRGVDLEVRSGQIVAVVGLVGAGKTETARLLVGADRPEGGELTIKGHKRSFKQPADAASAGIVIIPEERRKQGIVIHDSIERNISLPLLDKLSSFSFVVGKKEKELAERVVSAFGIKSSSIKQQVKYLSGGNQQKVAIGKWLEKDADVLVFDEPTKGVDVGAKSDIFKIIGELAAKGKGILYFTSELDEGLGIGDVIYVMYDGQIAAKFDRGDITEEAALYYASGGQGDYKK